VVGLSKVKEIIANWEQENRQGWLPNVRVLKDWKAAARVLQAKKKEEKGKGV